MCTAYFLNSHICQRNVTHEVSTCHTQTLPHHKMPMHPSLLKLLGQTHLEFLAKQVFFLDPATIHYPSKCWSSMQTTFKIRTDKNKFGKTKTYPNRYFINSSNAHIATIARVKDLMKPKNVFYETSKCHTNVFPGNYIQCVIDVS